MPAPIQTAFLSVVPSPYQRDLFAALARRDDIDLRVFYLEKNAPDSPWPDRPLQPHESILRGGWLPLGNARVHFNVPPCGLRGFDVVVMNTLMSATAQWLMRTTLRGRRWIFWGERFTGSGQLHHALAAPLARASAIAAIGALAANDYAARFPGVTVCNIPYHCALDGFLALPRPRNAVPVFLFCGQMIARKGVDLLLEAFAAVENARLLLVGREAELPALLAKLPTTVRSRVEYAGFQPPEELPRFFSRADAFVLPSRHDGWGVVVNQALAAGLPLLCSDAVGAAHDLIEQNKNGVMFRAGSVTALRDALQLVAGDRDLRERWGAASRARAADWTPERGAEKLAALFAKLESP
jgi:glycosyltransferase involved in cell wall biosynthesis